MPANYPLGVLTGDRIVFNAVTSMWERGVATDLVSSGVEFRLTNGGVAVFASVRRVTSLGRSSFALSLTVTRLDEDDVVLQWRSVVAGETSTARNRSLLAHLTDGTDTVVVNLSEVAATTTSDSFDDLAEVTLAAGTWIITATVDIEPPS